LPAIKALLGADDNACVQLISTPEGKAMAAMDLHTLSLRMLHLRDALPVPGIVAPIPLLLPLIFKMLRHSGTADVSLSDSS
jgi:hypothetical protein